MSISYGWTDVWELNLEVGYLCLKASATFGGSLRLKVSKIGCRCSVPLFIYTLAFPLQLRKSTENLTVAEHCWVLHIASTWPPCMGGLDWPAVHPSSSVDREGLQTALGRRLSVFQVAELSGSPHQITLSRSSWLMP
jgi:hypothetical protein